MIDKDKPTVVVSRCLGFANCRYDGVRKYHGFVQDLKPYVNYITVCPEVGIGLSVPRDPIDLVQTNKGEDVELYQESTANIYTQEMTDYSKETLDSLGEVHGFILKSRSPSCGVNDTKIYTGLVGGDYIKGSGMFAKATQQRYPEFLITTEAQLSNDTLRGHFLTKLYTYFEFRKTIKSNSLKDLIEFHSDNKYLLMAYSQRELDKLGNILANRVKRPFSSTTSDYSKHLALVFENPANKGSFINALMHMMGYLPEDLVDKEKDNILGKMEEYREGKIKLDVLTNLLKSYAEDYNIEYLLRQTILS